MLEQQFCRDNLPLSLLLQVPAHKQYENTFCLVLLSLPVVKH